MQPVYVRDMFRDRYNLLVTFVFARQKIYKQASVSWVVYCLCYIITHLNFCTVIGEFYVYTVTGVEFLKCELVYQCWWWRRMQYILFYRIKYKRQVRNKLCKYFFNLYIFEQANTTHLIYPNKYSQPSLHGRLDNFEPFALKFLFCRSLQTTLDELKLKLKIPAIYDIEVRVDKKNTCVDRFHSKMKFFDKFLQVLRL